MKRMVMTAVLGAFVLAAMMAGCGVDEVTVREIAREEAMNAIDMYTKSFAPDKFGFGVGWEKDFSYAQGVKTGNMIFVAGQLAHGQTVDRQERRTARRSWDGATQYSTHREDICESSRRHPKLRGSGERIDVQPEGCGGNYGEREQPTPVAFGDGLWYLESLPSRCR